MQARSYLTSGNCTCQAATGARAGKALDFIYRNGGQSFTYNACPVPGVCTGAYCNPYNCTNTKCFANGCAAARAGFCNKFGNQKFCPSLNRNTCYNECCPPRNAYDDQALEGVIIAKLSGICHRVFTNQEINTIAVWLNGYTSIKKSIGDALKVCNVTLANNYITQAANAVRCANKDHPIIKTTCDSGCPGGGGTGGGGCPTGQVKNSAGKCVPSNDKCVPCVGVIECLSNLGCNIGNFFTDAFRGGPDQIDKILSNQNTVLIGFGVAAIAMVFILKK